MAKKLTSNDIEIGVVEVETEEYTETKDCKVLFTIGKSVAFDFDGYGYMFGDTKKPYKRNDIITVLYSGVPATEGFVFTEA